MVYGVKCFGKVEEYHTYSRSHFKVLEAITGDFN